MSLVVNQEPPISAYSQVLDASDHDALLFKIRQITFHPFRLLLSPSLFSWKSKQF